MKRKFLYARSRFLVFLFALFVSPVAAVQAATLTVTSPHFGGPGSLSEAIFVAEPGDTINFDLSDCPCVIRFGQELIISKNLTILGPGPDQLILDGDARSRIFRINSGVTATIHGVRIFGGIAPGGGGINNAGGTLTVSNCIIDHNQATVTASSAGGGILSTSGSVTIINTTISENVAASSGGGLANNSSSSMKIINSTISLNQAFNIGGGISNLGTLSVTNSTVTSNSGAFGSLNVASGINAAGNEALANTIVAGNRAHDEFTDDIGGVIENASHCLISDAATSGGISHGENGNIVGNYGVGSIDPSTLFLDLVPGNFGGTALTLALAPGSPAINAGSNALALDLSNNPLLTDQRGAGFPRISNGTVDIGAFERQTLYSFTGFFQPVDNLPVVNVATAGGSIPLKFSLSGFHGFGIFAIGFPTSGQVQCNLSEPAGEVEETVNSGGSSLTYDALTDRYTYVWKTNKAWKGTCRLMTVRFDDGTVRSAKFRLR